MQAAAVIGLGANLGNALGMIREALRLLAATPGLRPLAVSRVYLTEPQGGPKGQNWYHNAAAFLANDLPPRRLLARLMTIEKALGRDRLVHWGPRTIDLDYLAEGTVIIDEPPELVLPHPRMEERLFVMGPLAEAAGGWRHPVSGRLARDTAAALAETGGQAVERLEDDLTGDFFTDPGPVRRPSNR
jgi:2-amino-4-hydroxy-6-hydroxymethyldihydropteridine diphosphokinase